ncbi:glycosyltransferase family 2 protein [Niabella sp. CC-SYL272]|uniref:glycosyltransferase family 2 protein n=1 Tax=Niabella agricola TaxID=2891571 RepID=UPI001F458414|nr:glycosyltransferase family 2 protein [Niabella agricola]MCF3108491.1 glycosyltransferase family 2 protein [Niabella agricola]
MYQPLVSFCMSTYKRPDLLYNQLHCILEQTYPHFEIVISDNDTEQSGKQAVEKINDPRVKYFPNNANLGMVASFNASIGRSNGEFIVMITDDDPAYPHMLTDLVALLNQHPGYGVYGGCGDWMVENEFAAKTLHLPVGKTTHLLKTMQEDEVKLMPADQFAAAYLNGFFSTTFLLWSCLMVERSILLEIKGMPNYGSELLTDHAFVIAAGSKKGMAYQNKAMGGQVVHGDNFGYNIFKLRDKYIHTPQWFYDYLALQLNQRSDWQALVPKIWNFAGRSWVEYTLLVARANTGKDQKKELNKLIPEAFKNKNIHKWIYKFYLKYYFPSLFNILLSVKKIWK